MNSQLTAYYLRSARQHPIRALRLGTLAMEGRRRALLVVVPVRRAMNDPKVHAEARRATVDARRAVLRVQRVGVTNALTDRCVARDLRHVQAVMSRGRRASLPALLGIGSGMR